MVLPTVGWTLIWVFCKYNRFEILSWWNSWSRDIQYLVSWKIVQTPEVLMNITFGGSRDAYEMIMILVPETLLTVSLRVRRERNTWNFCQVFFLLQELPGLHHLLLQWGVVLTRFGRAESMCWDLSQKGLIQNQGSFPSWSINLYLLQFWGSVVRYGLVLGLLNFCFFNLRVSSFLISQTTSATWIFWTPRT